MDAVNLTHERSTSQVNLITITRELPADFDTPASIYLKLAGEQPSFLLESVTGGEQLARYSFIGVDLDEAFILNDHKLVHHTATNVQTTDLSDGTNPFDLLNEYIDQFQPEPLNGLPRFSGGLVGYIGYDTIRYFEPSVALQPHPKLPDAILLVVKSLVAVDHAFGKILLIANAVIEDDHDTAIAEAQKRLDELERRIYQPRPIEMGAKPFNHKDQFQSNITRDKFEAAVKQAQEHIAAGDIFQVVLSQRLSRKTEANPFDIYRALRRLNPSPYMFFFNFGSLSGDDHLYLIGASPEMHVRLENQIAALRPIAGTRKRGNTPEEDQRLAEDLLSDPKECAEHIMLVDLGRNDLGRVCEYGSVDVSELMGIERYSHVMHIVSHIDGDLKVEHNGFDLLQATFPAGTVSGAPKIRAMQIIENLETTPRGPYAGVVGFISYRGTLDSCIVIRTIIMQGDDVSVQAGAGIVADSDPSAEYEETLSKAQALTEAILLAEEGCSNDPRYR